MAAFLHQPVFVIDQMPYTEYLKWQLYLDERPMGWREDSRVSKLLAAQGVKDAERLFESLVRLADKREKKATVGSKLLNSSFFQKIKQAVGGDKDVLDRL